ncbi:MAG: hypothetical protein ABEH78_03100 [Haloferacaceae archaeon]
MTLYAVDAIDDALDATRAFLWPCDRGRWARLALVALFVGGGGGFSPLQFPGSTPSGPGSGTGPPGMPGPDALPSVGGAELAAIVGVVAVVVLFALGFALVGAVMEFVLVESLRQEAVGLRRYWREHWRRGVRLFGFRIGLGLLTLGVAGLLAALFFAPVLLGEGGGLSVALLALVIPAFLLVAVVSGIVGGFTTVFVVPIMLLEERGLLAAWRRFWPTMTGQWRQYAAYAVLGWVLQLVAGIAAGVATLLAALVIAIPLGVVGLVGAGLLAVVEVAGWAVIAVAALLFVLALAALSLLVAVPVRTFLRYYALFVLGDTNEAFDVIPERRRAVRESTASDG